MSFAFLSWAYQALGVGGRLPGGRLIVRRGQRRTIEDALHRQPGRESDEHDMAPTTCVSHNI